MESGLEQYLDDEIISNPMEKNPIDKRSNSQRIIDPVSEVHEDKDPLTTDNDPLQENSPDQWHGSRPAVVKKVEDTSINQVPGTDQYGLNKPSAVTAATADNTATVNSSSNVQTPGDAIPGSGEQTANNPQKATPVRTVQKKWNMKVWLIMGAVVLGSVYLYSLSNGTNSSSNNNKSRQQSVKGEESSRESSMSFSGVTENSTLGDTSSQGRRGLGVSGNLNDSADKTTNNATNGNTGPNNGTNGSGQTNSTATTTTTTTTLAANNSIPIKDRNFAGTMRAGEKLEKIDSKEPLSEEALNAEKQEKKEKNIEKTINGLRIPMMLSEPFRSGIASTVTAEIIGDIRDAKGEVIIPDGSRALIPFSGSEVNGRVFNDQNREIAINLPNGNKISVKGIVKGYSDGFPGLAGKQSKTTSKKNALSRIGNGIGHVGGRIIGIQTGPYAGRSVEETVNEGVDGGLPYARSSRVVEIPSGTRLVLMVNQ